MEYNIPQPTWEAMLKFFQNEKGLHSKNESSLRCFMEAMWYITRSGCQWRLLPPQYGHWRTVHQRFKRWCNKGLWRRLMDAVKDSDLENVSLDSTIVRAHACAAGYKKTSQNQEGLGRSKGGFTSKIHALVDALGNPLKFILTPGQTHDVTQAQALTEGISCANVLADKGYDSQEFIDLLEERSCTAVIPPRSNRKTPRSCDYHLYKERHVVECFFSKIKHFRRIFSRFDKSSSSFLGFLYFVGTLIWLR